MKAALAALLLLAPACGYRVLDPEVGRGRRVAVPTADNATRWRGLEADLTAGLRSDLQRLLEVRLSDGGDADLLLHTEIREITRQAPVRDIQGGAAVGATRLVVLWRLEDPLGAVLGQGQIQRSLEFLPGEDENAYTALREMLDAIAEHVVMEVSARLSAGGADGASET